MEKTKTLERECIHSTLNSDEIWDFCNLCGAEVRGIFCSCKKRSKEKQLYFRNTLHRFMESEFFPYSKN